MIVLQVSIGNSSILGLSSPSGWLCPVFGVFMAGMLDVIGVLGGFVE